MIPVRSFRCMFSNWQFWVMSHQMRFPVFICRRKSFSYNMKYESERGGVSSLMLHTHLLCPREGLLFPEVDAAKTHKWSCAKDERDIQCIHQTLCSVLFFPVGCELQNCSNYQSLWLETIPLLPDTENVEKPAFLPPALYRSFVANLPDVPAEGISTFCFTDSIFTFLARVSF